MVALRPMHTHHPPHQGLTPVDEDLSPVQLVAKVRREIFAARSRELPWEYRVEWARRGGKPYPSFSVGRASTELSALRAAQTLLRDTTESADPRAVAAWIKGPGDVDYRRVAA
jgi:hypothetical protein